MTTDNISKIIPSKTAEQTLLNFFERLGEEDQLSETALYLECDVKRIFTPLLGEENTEKAWEFLYEHIETLILEGCTVNDLRQKRGLPTAANDLEVLQKSAENAIWTETLLTVAANLIYIFGQQNSKLEPNKVIDNVRIKLEAKYPHITQTL